MLWPSARSVCTKSDRIRNAVSIAAEIGDLAADMHVDAGDLDARQLGGARIDLARTRDRDAELVLGLAGGDLGVRAGIDVGIDAHRNPRGLAGLDGEPREQFEFRLGFDVDAEDVGGQRSAQLVLGLADAGEQDLVGGMPAASARFNSPPETTSAPAPSFASVRSTDWLEFAFMA